MHRATIPNRCSAILAPPCASVSSLTAPTFVELEGEAVLKASDVIVPRDPSSAAFPMVAALITEGSDLSIPGIGMNPFAQG